MVFFRLVYFANRMQSLSAIRLNLKKYLNANWTFYMSSMSWRIIIWFDFCTWQVCKIKAGN